MTPDNQDIKSRKIKKNKMKKMYICLLPVFQKKKYIKSIAINQKSFQLRIARNCPSIYLETISAEISLKSSKAKNVVPKNSMAKINSLCSKQTRNFSYDFSELPTP